MEQQFTVRVVPAAQTRQPAADGWLVEAWRAGHAHRLGPFPSEEDARNTLAVLRAKARQLAGDDGWQEEVGGLEREELDFICDTSWEGLLGELGGEVHPASASGAAQTAARSTSDGAAAAAAPARNAAAQDCTADGWGEGSEESLNITSSEGPGAASVHCTAGEAGSARQQQWQQQEKEQQQPQGEGRQQPAALSAKGQQRPEQAAAGLGTGGSQEDALQPGSSGYHGMARHGRAMQMRADSAWGRFSISSLHSAQLGGRLYDWAALWRAMRQAEAGRLGGTVIGADGLPAGGVCLPPPPQAQLPPRLNSPAATYLADSDLMAFLGRASHGQLLARLRQEAGLAVRVAVAGAAALEAAGAPAPAASGVPARGVTRLQNGIYSAHFTLNGTSKVLGCCTTPEEAGCVRDAGVIWRQLQNGEPPGSARLNFPQLGLAANAALLQQLRGVADLAALRAFLKDWAAQELPALVAQLRGEQPAHLADQHAPTGAAAAEAQGMQTAGQRQQQQHGSAPLNPVAGAAAHGGRSTGAPSTPPAKRARLQGGFSSPPGGGAAGRAAAAAPPIPRQSPPVGAASSQRPAAAPSPHTASAGHPPAASSMGPAGAAGAAGGGIPAPAAAGCEDPSSYEMIDMLQPLLETCGLERRLLGAFERHFPGLPPAQQRYLHRALARAVEFEGREAAEALLLDALKGGS